MKKTGIIILLLISFFSKAQTPVSGGIFSNQTWNLAGSPYIVNGDIAVFPGNTLTIESGVEIKVNGNFQIFIRGEVIFNGTANKPISFISNISTTSKNAWKGLRFENTSNNNILINYVNIENAYEAIAIDQSGSLTIKHCSINKNEYAVELSDANPWFTTTIDSTNFTDDTHGVWFSESLTMNYCNFNNGLKALWGSGIDIINCTFDNYSEYALRLLSGSVINSSISNSKIGINLNQGLIVTSCSFSNNVKAAIIVPSFSFSNTMTLCSFCNNTIDIEHLGSYNFDISNNCWCSADNDPAGGIIDGYDNVSLGIVNFTPFATSNCGSTVTEVINPVNFQKNNINIYPNPTTGLINIDFEKNKSNLNLKLINALGQVILAKKYMSTNRINFDLGAPKGIYLLLLESDGEVITKKILKE